MEPIYGNHVGIVINNNDPEARGRLQIFIPHLTNTLFAGWNDQLKNISFKTFESGPFSPTIKEKLIEMLPWAEGAVPTFGGGSSGRINTSTGKTVTSGNLQDATSANPQATPPPDTTLPTTAGFQNKSGDFDIINNAVQQTPSVTTSQYSATVNGNNIKIDGNGLDTSRIETTGANTNTSTILADGKISSSSFPYVALPSNYPKGPYQLSANGKTVIVMNMDDTGGKNNPNVNAGGDGNLEISLYAAQALNVNMVKPVDDIYTQNSGNVSIEPVTSGPYAGWTSNKGILVDANGTQVTSAMAASAGLTTQVPPEGQQKIADLMNSGTPNDGTQESSPVQMTCGGTRRLPSSITDASGFLSTPTVGAKVWVFFHNGDIQRPVYFASTLEANTVAALTQPQNDIMFTG